jgi:hypothetical protein
MILGLFGFRGREMSCSKSGCSTFAFAIRHDLLVGGRVVEGKMEMEFRQETEGGLTL